MTKQTKIIIVLIILILAAGSWLVFRDKNTATQDIVGGDKDEHGCIGPAGYSWCEPKQKCLRPWEELCDANAAAEAIKQLLMAKYKKPANAISVSIGKSQGNFVRGSISFGAGAPGGIFLAARVNGVWELAYDGNGPISCDLSSKYGFPTEMISDCAQ